MSGGFQVGAFQTNFQQVGVAPPVVVVTPKREGGTMYAPSKDMEAFALAMRDDEELLLIAPMLAFIAEQNRTLQ